jgi:hypothetical protein
MFECPECGGVIETTRTCDICSACDYFAERHLIDLNEEVLRAAV